MKGHEEEMIQSRWKKDVENSIFEVEKAAGVIGLKVNIRTVVKKYIYHESPVNSSTPPQRRSFKESSTTTFFTLGLIC